jgi:hypothetical protein
MHLLVFRSFIAVVRWVRRLIDVVYWYLKLEVVALALVCVCSLAEATSVSLLGIAFFFLCIFGYYIVPCVHVVWVKVWNGKM